MRVVLITSVVLSLATPAAPQSCLDAIERGLEMLCSTNVARSGSKSSAEAEAEARLNVSAMLRALFGGEASVRGRAVAEEYANVLQEDVPDLQAAISKCRITMYPILRDDFCAADAPVAATPESWQGGSPQPAPAPDDYDPRVNVISDMIAAGELNGAVRLAEQVAAERPGQDRTGAMFLAGVAMFRLAMQAGDAILAERAIGYFERVGEDAEQLAPADRSQFLSARAAAHWAAGALSHDFMRLAEAESYSREALQLSPDNLMASENLGMVLATRGLLTRNHLELREGVSLLRLARIEYERLGQFDAVQSLDQHIRDFCREGGC